MWPVFSILCKTSLICARLMPLTLRPRKGVLLQSPRVTRAVTLAPTLLREPFACDGFERLKLRDASLVFFLLLLSARIDVVSEQPPRFVPLLASPLERHIRVHAEREHLFGLARLPISPTAEPVLEPPPLVAILADEQRASNSCLAPSLFRPEYSSAALGVSTPIRNKSFQIPLVNTPDRSKMSTDDSSHPKLEFSGFSSNSEDLWIFLDVLGSGNGGGGVHRGAVAPRRA